MDVLQVGYGKRGLGEGPGDPMGGTFSDQRATKVRDGDGLFARTIKLKQGLTEVFIVAVDLLIITQELHQAVADRLETPLSSIFLHATHTHSATGGYWQGRLAEMNLGTYDQEIFDRLVHAIVMAMREANEDLKPAKSMRSGSAQAPMSTLNRIRANGPTDDEVTVVHIERDGGVPVKIINFAGHPVIVHVLQPSTLSADRMGMVCRAIEQRDGAEVMVLTGAVGGLSGLFPEVPADMEKHLTHVSDTLVLAHDRAMANLRGVGTSHQLKAHLLSVPITRGRRPIFPPQAGRMMRRHPVDAVKHWATTLAFRHIAKPLMQDSHAPVQIVYLEGFAIVGTPMDLGVMAALELKRRLRANCYTAVLPVSQCAHYLGYHDLPSETPPGLVDITYGDAWYEHMMGFNLVDFADACLNHVGRILTHPY